MITTAFKNIEKTTATSQPETICEKRNKLQNPIELGEKDEVLV